MDDRDYDFLVSRLEAKAEFLQGRLLLSAGDDKGLISQAKALRGDARLADQCLHTG